MRIFAVGTKILGGGGWPTFGGPVPRACAPPPSPTSNRPWVRSFGCGRRLWPGCSGRAVVCEKSPPVRHSTAHCACRTLSDDCRWVMIAGVQDSDVRPFRRHSAAESSDERAEDRVTDVCRQPRTWRRGRQWTLEPATHWHCWPRGIAVYSSQSRATCEHFSA